MMLLCSSGEDRGRPAAHRGLIIFLVQLAHQVDFEVAFGE